MKKWIIIILTVMMMVKLVGAEIELTTSDSFDFLKEDGWGDIQIVETKDYKLSTFHTDFHCGLGHCEVPFYFNTNIVIFDKLDFKVSSDVPLRNIYVKRVLGKDNETLVSSLTFMEQNNTYYYKLYFDYDTEWTKGIIKRVKSVKFNISAYLGFNKVLEIDPIAHQSVAGGSTDYIDTLKIEWEHTINCNDDLVLIVGVATDSDVQDQVTSIIYNDVPLTKLMSLQSADGQVVGDYWNLSDPDCGDAYWVNVTGNAHEDAAGVSTVYAFVDYINNDSMAYDRSDLSSFATIAVTTTSADELVVDMFALDVDPDADAVGDNQVERHEVDENDVQMSTSDGWHASGTVNMNWSGFSDEWVLMGVPLIPAADTRAPVWTLNISNVSSLYPFVNDYVETQINWSDKFAINYTWFSSNFTGSWVNATPVPVSGNLSHKLITKTQVTVGGKTVCWTSYANDSSGNLNQSSMDCLLVYKYGGLNVSISLPVDNHSLTQNDTFDLNVSVYCSGGVGAKCGIVNALARYNKTALPDTVINVTEDTPVFISGFSQVEQITCSNLTNLGDSLVLESVPDLNFGSNTNLRVSADDDGILQRSFIKFNTSINLTSSINNILNATLNLYLYSRSGTCVNGRTTEVYNTTEFSESVITWNNQPEIGNLQNSVTMPSGFDIWQSWNVTTAMNYSFYNSLNLTLLLKDSLENQPVCYWDYYSKEGTTPPYLEVCYNETVTSGVPNPQTSPSTLSNGENWNTSWVINATGLNSTQWLIDVIFNSTTYYPNILFNDTVNRRICIGDCPSEAVEDVTPPILTFKPPTDINVTITTRNWTYVNISSNEALDNCTLNWNKSSINYSMNLLTTDIFWYNVTDLVNYNYTYNVSCNDTSGNLGDSSTIWVNISYAPVLDTCTCPAPAANWNVDCSDTCSISTVCDLEGFDITIAGTSGSFEILEDITADSFKYQPGCIIRNIPKDGNELRIKT